MRPLRFSLQLTLDGRYDHRGGIPDEGVHRHAAASIARADAILFGRVTYQMMEQAWRRPASGAWPDWMAPWMVPFAETIDAARKYVVSRTLDHVDWNAELVRGDLCEAVTRLKAEPGQGIFVGGAQLAFALTELGLIDEYEFVVHPRVLGYGPVLFAGLSKPLDLTLVDRVELPSGAVALRYARRSPFDGAADRRRNPAP